VPDDRFLASETSWMEQARCKGAVLDFVPFTETAEELASARDGWCNLCPVRVECLGYALLYHLSGYWGGTNTAERRALGKPLNRVKCPSCKKQAIIPTPDGHEICQYCGVSWMGSPSRMPEEAAG